MVKLIKLIEYLFISLIKLYALFVSPFLGSHCRFYPTCSSYAQEALRKHGLFKGSYLALRRLLRCHPLSSGGFDYVPEAFKETH